MSSNSAIQWTDTTWNPVVGCTMVSPGCAHCYAETMSNRLRGMALADEKDGKSPGRKAHYLKVVNEDGRWNGRVELVPEALADPLKWKKPRRVFVNSMSDLFHEGVAFDFIDKVFAVMALCPQHTFQVLTKRPERMAEYLKRERPTDPDLQGNVGRWLVDGHITTRDWPLPNVWLGTSVENQKAADERIPHLLRCLAAVRFLSCEPLLGAIDLDLSFDGIASLRPIRRADPSCNRNGAPVINWCIVGGESGRGSRECDVRWINSIRKQCAAAGVPCFIKQLGKRPVTTDPELRCGMIKDCKGGEPSEWPEELRVREFPKQGVASDHPERG
jgi:protein gp37